MKDPLLAARSFARIAACVALLAHAGCEQAPGSTSTGGGAPTSSEGGGGSGGDTGFPTTSSTTTTTAAPLTCSVPVTKPAITQGECDLLQQDCPPGETCIPTMDGKSTLCRIGGGLKGAGKACTLNDECQAGLFCVGFCTQACCPADDQPCGGGDCNIELGLPGGLTLFTCSYSEECALFGQDTCKNGQKCQFVYPNQGQAVCTIPASNPAAEGEPCAYVNECGSMQICFQGFCRYNCKLSGGGTPGTGGCPAGQSCEAVFQASAGDVGVCQ